MLKVIIADDEERICQLINALVDWETLQMEVVGIAHNGLEASDMVKQMRPDILITDIRMPGCNGLELIEDVRKNVANLEIIIISGYAHFAYAQTAIKFGVGDYLLKPINKSELVSTLSKLKERIEGRLAVEERRQMMREKSAKDIRRLQSNLIERLVEKRDEVLTADILRKEYYLNVQDGIYQAFWVSADEGSEDISQAGSTIVLEKVQNILESSLKSRCTQLLIGQSMNACVGFLNYKEEQQEEIRHIFKDCLNQLEAGRTMYGNITFSAALGCAVTQAEKLGESFEEASVIIKERLVKGSGRLLERLPAPSTLSNQNFAEKYLRLIVHAVEIMSVEEADTVVHDMEEDVKNIKDARGYEIHELIVSAANLFLSQVDAANRAERLKHFERVCALCGSTKQLFEQLRLLQAGYLEEMNRLHDTDTARPIRLAKQYIQNHFREPITQEEVSSAVGLSAAYFSVLFKKVEGEGFAKYLINIRIEQAKILLRETNIPVSKVCQEVGYNDLKHFTHTFEKATGVKPTIYRKLYG